MRRILVLLAALALPGSGSAGASTDAPSALKNTVILVIRHAEKPETGNTLTPAGEERARAYARYFQNFALGSETFKADALFAAADSENSRRPRLTIEPLARALGLRIDTRFRDKDPKALASELRSKAYGGHLLVCWHHGEIPELLQALGADPALLLPGGKWPAETFDWVIALRYDQDGRLLPGEVKCIHEHLMPGDAK
jgi:broad specificity phosphatase PhoE